MEDKDEMEEKEGPRLFGRDISKIPCFRSTFLFSISSGIGTGLGYFLFTSKAQNAFRFGYWTFFFTTLGYWGQCRYRYEKQVKEIRRIADALKSKDDETIIGDEA